MSIQTIPLPSSSSLYSRVAFVTTSTTWAHPDGYSQPRPVKVIKFNGGNGGTGGGARANTSSIAGNDGGGGGASGFVQIQESYVTSDLTITIGAGGSGSAGAVLTTNSNASNVPASTYGGIGGTTTVLGTGVYMVMSNTNIAWSAFNTSSYSAVADGPRNVGMSGGGQGGNVTGGDVSWIGGAWGLPANATGNGSQGSGGMLSPYKSVGGNASGALWLPTVQYAPGGGGGGSGAPTSATTVAGPAGGVHAVVTTLSGGQGGSGVGASNANATGGNGSTGGIFCNGGGGGGGASVQIVGGVALTATGGNGGTGGAGGVIIFY